MSNTKTIVIELEDWQVERMRGIVNAIKDFNRITDDKGCIDYNLICKLDGADDFLADHLCLEQSRCEHGIRYWYSDYTWKELEDIE